MLQQKYAGNFQAYINTRMRSYKDHGSHVTVETEGGHTITAKSLFQATNVPLHVGSVVIKEGYWRTYCVAQAAPDSAYPDILLYDNDEIYIYVRKTAHPTDPSKCYIVTGGEDHKVGKETTEGYHSRFEKLAKWTKEHFPEAEAVPDYAWSGQIVEPNDYMAFIGRNTGTDQNVYVCTGDSGNGLTHGVIAGRIITDLITGNEATNPWASLYSPSRKPKPRTIPEDIKENVSQNKEYMRYLKSDAHDIEDIPVGCGAVMGGLTKLGKPIAVYKGENGEVKRFSAVCPHMAGVVAWNAVEKTWDCPSKWKKNSKPGLFACSFLVV